jgi:hypothetical protein
MPNIDLLAAGNCCLVWIGVPFSLVGFAAISRQPRGVSPMIDEWGLVVVGMIGARRNSLERAGRDDLI